MVFLSSQEVCDALCSHLHSLSSPRHHTNHVQALVWLGLGGVLIFGAACLIG